MHRAFVITAALAAGAASADITTVVYDFPTNANVALNYGWFGGNEPIEGEIISTRIFIDYNAPDPLNAADFSSRFLVPVLEPLGGSEAFIVNGSDIGWVGSGDFTYSHETDAFNGTIRPGRFGWEVEGGGTLAEGSRIEFDVRVVPAPSTAGALAAVGLLALRRRR